MKSNKETYLNQVVHEYKRLIVSGINESDVMNIMGTETQQCTDVPTIDIQYAPDYRTKKDIMKRILVIMDDEVLSAIANMVFSHLNCEKLFNKELEVSVAIKYPFRDDARSGHPTKEDDDKWYYNHTVEVIVTDRSNGHDVFSIVFRVLGGYIAKKDCAIHLYINHLEEEVSFIMPYLEKGIKDYLKTKRD